MKRILFLTGAAAIILALVYLVPGCDELVTERIVTIEAGHPQAEFEATPDSGCEPLTVTLNDQSNGPRDQATWYFYKGSTGDPFDSIVMTAGPGDSAILNADTSYTFDSAGTYSIRLTIRDTEDDGIDSEFKKRAVIVGTSVLDFGASDTIICRGDTVTFNPNVLDFGAVDTWSWSFGDGTTPSTDSIPKHAYNTAGLYTVILNATGPCGTKTIIDSNLVRVVACPTVEFTADTTVGCVPLTVSFFDSTQLDTAQQVAIQTRVWNVGTGTNPGQLDSIQVIYNTAGTYDAMLALTFLFAVGEDTVSITRTDSVADYITVFDNTSASFSALSPTESCKSPFQQFQVMFQADQAGDFDSLVWEWGDGTRFVDSADTPKIPVHAYVDPGQYNVTLMAYGACGNDTVTQENFITLATPIQADSVSWTVNPATGTVADEFVFTNTTNGLATDIEWDFSGGNTATGSQVTHTFEAAGTFTIGLSVGNVCNTIDTTFEITVTDTTGG